MAVVFGRADNHNESQTVLTRVLANWSVVPDSVERATGGFSTSSVYCVRELSGRTFALRRTPVAVSPGPTPRQVVCKLLKELRSAGLEQIAAPIDRVQRVVDPHSAAPACDSWEVFDDDAVWHLEPWLPGSSLTGPLVTRSMLCEAVSLIRLVHESAKTWAMRVCPGSLPVTRGRSLAVQRRLLIAESLESGELAFLRQRLDRLEAPLRAGAVELLRVLETRLPDLGHRLYRAAGTNVLRQPVLGDLWRAHVLFDAEHVSGLIDFWNCRSDHPGVDFARLFRSWFAVDNERIREAWEISLCGRLLTDAEANLLSALDQCTVLFSPLTWLRTLLQADGADGPPPGAERRFLELAGIAAGFQPVSDWR